MPIATGTTCTLVGTALLIGLSATLEWAGYGPPPAARVFVAATVLLAPRRRSIRHGSRGTEVMLAVLASAVPFYATLWQCNWLSYLG